MLLTLDCSKRGITNAQLISENVSVISKATGLDTKEIRKSYESVQNDTNQLAFGVGERNKVGY